MRNLQSIPVTLRSFRKNCAGTFFLRPFRRSTSQPAVLRLIPVLQVARMMDTVILNWLGTYVLQSATNAQGPYIDLFSGANAYTNDGTAVVLSSAVAG